MPIVRDPDHLKMLADAWPKPPTERIVRSELLLTAINRDTGGISKDVRVRMVKLECGHTVASRNLVRAGCPHCHEMILGGGDYDAFRNLGNYFAWEEWSEFAENLKR